MASRRALLSGLLSTLVGVLLPSSIVAGADGRTVELTVENGTYADLELTPGHDFVSEDGDGLDIAIGESGPGLEPDGLTEFDEFFEVSNPGDEAVLFGIDSPSSVFGDDGPLALEVGGDSLVVTDVEEGVELASGESVAVDVQVDFLNEETVDIAETVTLVDDTAHVEVVTGAATANSEWSATLDGELTALENADSAEVGFEYGVAGTGLSEETPRSTFSEPQPFDVIVGGLTGGTTYEYRAFAEAEDARATGSVETVTTDESSGCFITTATVGESEELDALRRFRDESLSTTPLGRALVGMYYRISPPIASTIERHPDSYTVRIGRRLIGYCAALSEIQERTDPRLYSAALGTALTALYAVGVLIAAWGFTVMRAVEFAENRR